MLSGFTILVMVLLVYSMFREGLLTAIATLVNICLAGVVAFNFFEPIAEELDSMVKGTFLAGFEDGICLFALFSIVFGALRLTTNNLASQDLELPAMMQQVVTALVSLVSGYLLAGFLVVFLQTLPLSEKFLDFEYQVDPSAPKTRMFLPPDRVWLGMMHRAGLGPFSQADGVTFDPEGNFEMRYARLRRFKDVP